MNHKRNKKKFLPSLFYLIMLIAVIVLGSFGVEIPNEIKAMIGLNTTQKTEQVAHPGRPPQELGKATFTANELQNAQKGWIRYGEIDRFGRATIAKALLKPQMVNTGTPANSNVRPVGFISGNEPHNHSRGHIIGRQLGGSGDDPRNLTTLYQTPVNTPYMTKYENIVRKALDNGETILYRVTPVYENDHLLCKEIIIEAKGLNKNSAIDFKVLITNEK